MLQPSATTLAPTATDAIQPVQIDCHDFLHALKHKLLPVDRLKIRRQPDDDPPPQQILLT